MKGFPLLAVALAASLLAGCGGGEPTAAPQSVEQQMETLAAKVKDGSMTTADAAAAGRSYLADSGSLTKAQADDLRASGNGRSREQSGPYSPGVFAWVFALSRAILISGDTCPSCTDAFVSGGGGLFLGNGASGNWETGNWVAGSTGGWGLVAGDGTNVGCGSCLIPQSVHTNEK